MPFDSVRLWQSSKRWFRLAGCRSRPWVEASLGPAAPKHGIKRVDRLLGNRHLWAERWLIFDSMIWCVLRGGAWRRHRAIRVAADNPGGLGPRPLAISAFSSQLCRSAVERSRFISRFIPSAGLEIQRCRHDFCARFEISSHPVVAQSS